jgi:hypothetical protein
MQHSSAQVEAESAQAKHHAAVLSFSAKVKLSSADSWGVVSRMKPDLGNFGVQALTHLHSSMGDEHCSIGVDVHQRCSLVQELGSEGDAKLGGDDSQAALAPPVGFVEVIHCRLPLCKMCLADHTIPASLHQKFASAFS